VRYPVARGPFHHLIERLIEDQVELPIDLVFLPEKPL
jgi:hypothetical protein